MSLEQIGTPILIFFVALVVTASFVLLRTSRYYANKRRDEADWSRTRDEAGKRQARNLDGSPEAIQGEVEIHDNISELKARLDDKMRTLQILIYEANQAAERLESALKSREEKSSACSPKPRSPLFNPQAGIASKEEKM